MRHSLYATLFLFLVPVWAHTQVPCEPFGEQSVQVMTYNIRLDTENDRGNAWPHRRDFLADQVRYHLPDVLGTQEGLPHQIDWLDENLTEYAYVGEGRRGGHAGEYSAIFYNRHRLRVKDSGTFWLSDTPDQVSTGWDAALPRICTWARFAERTGARDFLVFNTHFDHVGKQARINSVDVILRMVDSLSPDGLPYVVMGDLNLTPETEPLRKLSAAMTDTYGAADISLGPEGTFTGFRHDVPATRRIDYVFVSGSPRVEVSRYAVLTDAIDGRYPSDHLPVTATLHLRPRPVIVAHRGASGHIVENSLAAFQQAVDLQADMVELDVFTLKDGEVVCFHDDELERLTGTTGRITDYTLSELNQLVLAGKYKIPRLRDALLVMDKQLRVNVELKGPGTAGPALAVLREFISDHGWKMEDFHISSFRHDELRRMRELDARIEIGVLPAGDPLKALDVAREVEAYSINAHHRYLNEKSVKAIHDAGFRIYAWTVNDRATIHRLQDLGIEGIITNYPDRARSVFSE